MPGWCNICERLTIFTIRGRIFREDVSCIHCRSSNRSRQMQHVFQMELKKHTKALHTITIWNTESSRSFHEKLKTVFRDRYISSEYFGPDIKSGDFVHGVRQEDICNTSFTSNYFDFILSGDVLEHIPRPERALNEIHRVLKRDGKFIFTVPFMENVPKSDIRAKLKEDGIIEHFKKPIYHVDPLRQQGILAYVIFGEDLLEMCKKTGLICKKVKLRKPLYGIIGTNAIVFVAERMDSVKSSAFN